MTPRERERAQRALTRMLAHAAPASAVACTQCSVSVAPPPCQCALCGQPMDPQPEARPLDGMLDTGAGDDLLVCTDCGAETTKTKRRDPRC